MIFWYVIWARAEGAHAEFWAWHMLIKYLICVIYSKIVIFLSGAFLGNRMGGTTICRWISSASYFRSPVGAGRHLYASFWNLCSLVQVLRKELQSVSFIIFQRLHSMSPVSFAFLFSF